MSTIYDFVTVLVFVGVVTLFLHFSRHNEQSFGPYFLVSLLMAVANQVGNMGHDIFAWIMIAGGLGLVYMMILKPNGVGQK